MQRFVTASHPSWIGSLLLVSACASEPEGDLLGAAGTASGNAGAGGASAGSSAGGMAGAADELGGRAGSANGGSAGRAGSGGSAGRAGASGKAGAASGGASGGSGASGAAGKASVNRDEFFGESRCTADFDLCEDFEAATLDSATWQVRGPAPSIDSARAARGTRSAHFHTEDNGLSLITQTNTFPAANNTYYARAFVYFDTMPTAPRWAHWSISGAVGSSTEAEIRVGGQYDGETNRFGVGTDHGPTGDWTSLDQDPSGDPAPVPVDSWVCIEWLHKGDTDETRFWWDGVEHPSLATSATQHGGTQSEQYLLPEFESVWFGWWLYQAGTTPPEFDVWIDEIAVDGERIGCTR